MVSVSNWAARHGHALVSSCGHLARHRIATAFTVIVMGLALALPLGLELLVRNLHAATGDFSASQLRPSFDSIEIDNALARPIHHVAVCGAGGLETCGDAAGFSPRVRLD